MSAWSCGSIINEIRVGLRAEYSDEGNLERTDVQKEVHQESLNMQQPGDRTVCRERAAEKHSQGHTTWTKIHNGWCGKDGIWVFFLFCPVLLFHTMRGLCTLGETIRVLSVQWCHWSGKYQHSPYCKNFTYANLPSRTRPPLKTLWVPCPYGHPSIHKQGELSLPLCHFWFLLPRAVLHLALFCSHPFILPHSCWAFFTLSNLPFSLHKSSYSSTSPDTVNKSIWCHGLPSWDTFPTKIFIFLFQTLFNLSFNFFLLLEVDCFLT